MADAADYEHMARALELAAKGLCSTDPNPTVGCVLVRDGRVIAEGFTAPAGGPHAEAVALAAAGHATRGATAYVTLEPCSHQGRTGPCSSSLIEAGVARVVFSVTDPNPRVAGAGRRALEEAGIEVESGVLESAAAKINAGFFSRMQRGRPWVRSKLAATLDGRTALHDGKSQWITGSTARRDVHRWRARSSAVLTGVGTVLRDDPSLTARLEDEDYAILQPARVILDSNLRTPPTARLLSLPGEVLIFTTLEGGDAWRALEQAGARIERVSGGARCDAAEVMERLGRLEINDVWVEAGASVNGTLLEAGLIDELIVYVAPDVLGDTARGMFAIDGIVSLDQRISLEFEDVRRVGRDLRITARPSG